MKLTEAFKIETAANIVLVGKPEVTNFETSDGEPYYVAKLKEPVMVRCSVDKGIDAFETEEVYIRESALEGDWTFVDEKKPEEGYYMKDWKVDFSKGQELVLYQETTIAKWTKTDRANRADVRRTGINARLQERLKNKK